uniref:Divergent polysaccharide deacetylase family protein n=1 Tax=Magnetococcus massalia (strain MO-1) TaxID=451514 RepID=A0A1S7LKC1_MAGMO|nr:conserved exported protein of unknown function [Candidatus Magnetococcus massalia]
MMKTTHRRVNAQWQQAGKTRWDFLVGLALLVALGSLFTFLLAGGPWANVEGFKPSPWADQFDTQKAAQLVELQTIAVAADSDEQGKRAEGEVSAAEALAAAQLEDFEPIKAPSKQLRKEKVKEAIKQPASAQAAKKTSDKKAQSAQQAGEKKAAVHKTKERAKERAKKVEKAVEPAKKSAKPASAKASSTKPSKPKPSKTQSVKTGRKTQTPIVYEEAMSDDLDKPDPAEKRVKPNRKRSRKVRIAMVIDDLGYNGPIGRAIVKLPADITLAVLPGGPYSRQLVNIGHRMGRELILHQPMEPKGFPRVDPGPGALLQGMSSKQVQRILNHNLDQFPEVVGVNNHMGSSVTENRGVMNAVMKVLVKRELYFIDSRTSAKSVAYRAASRYGVPRAKRSVFIDNRRTVSAVLKRLDELVAYAKRNGYGIGIGHPYGVTLKALRMWLPTLEEQDVEVIRASRLLTPESSRKWFLPQN